MENTKCPDCGEEIPHKGKCAAVRLEELRYCLSNPTSNANFEALREAEFWLQKEIAARLGTEPPVWDLKGVL